VSEHATGEPLRDAELLPDVIDAGTAAGGAQKFPEAASRRISFSSVKSDTAFRSRSFSFSSSFSRFTWLVSDRKSMAVVHALGPHGRAW